MTLPTSGEINASQIQTEFGGTNPINVAAEYASYVGKSSTTGSNVKFSDFYGKSSSVTVSAVTSAVSTATTITLPTVQTNDIVVLFDQASASTADQSAVPLTDITPSIINGSGSFTKITTRSYYIGFIGKAYFRDTISYKIVTATDSGKTITGLDPRDPTTNTGDFFVKKALWVFRPSRLATINVGTISFGNTGTGIMPSKTDIPAQTINVSALPSTTTAILFGAAFRESSSSERTVLNFVSSPFVSPDGNSVISTSPSGVYDSIRLGYKIQQNITHSNISVDINPNLSYCIIATLHSFYLTLT